MFRHNARLRKQRPSSPPVFGRGGETSSPPKTGGEERGLLLLPSRFQEGRSVGRAGWRAAPAPGVATGHTCGGEEECTGTADTNPGCNYLVRGYSPSMHYFWRGDMPHFSSPLPFQRGRAECRRVLARDLGGPIGGARACRAAAVPRPLRRARRQPRPARHPCIRGPARRSPRAPSAAGRDRRNLKLARRTGRGPAEASAGPRRRRPCPIFTLLLILLTTPS